MLSPLPGLAWRSADEGGTGQQVSAHQLALQASKVVSLARMQGERTCRESAHAWRARMQREHACTESMHAWRARDAKRVCACMIACLAIALSRILASLRLRTYSTVHLVVCVCFRVRCIALRAACCTRVNKLT